MSQPASVLAPLWWRLLRGILLGWASLGGMLWLAQTWMLFPGVWRLDSSPASVASLEVIAQQAGVRVAHIPRADGGEVYAWHYPSQGERAVLYFHGNAERVDKALPLGLLAQQQGFDFVEVVARGFPGAPGTPVQDALVADAEVALRWVESELHIPPERVVLHGHSMGGGVASQLAARVPVGGLVLDSTYDCLADLAAQKVLHLYPTRRMLRSTFDSHAAAAQIHAPVFQVHSRADTLIPIDQPRRLREAHRDLSFVEVDDYPHSAMILLRDKEAQRAWIRFLSEAVPLRRGEQGR